MQRFAGIDYGSKMAGTTSVAIQFDDEIRVFQSEKNTDADAFILSTLAEYNILHVYLDAPLSLPYAYFGKGDDFFYRKADKMLQAMSPLFLGGLSARAMKLKHDLSKKNITCTEVYPKALVQELQLSHYKLDLVLFNKSLAEKLQLTINTSNWHQSDSILAWYSGFRHLQGFAKYFGDKGEGIITI
jgi:predicted nuclease with RNAse H fold